MNKKVLYIGLAIIVVCLAITYLGMYLNRSTSRAPTPEETASFEAYDPALTRDGILEECTYAEQAQIGQNMYKTYTSQTLSGMLYSCDELQRIAVDDEDYLYIQYSDGTAGRMVTLVYSEAGLQELGVYEQSRDILYHRLDGETEVWERFTTGIQWGRK